MKNHYRWTVAALCVTGLIGCSGAKKQREQILANQADMQERLRQTQAREEQMLKNQDEAKKRDEEMVKIASAGVTTQQDILTIVRGNQAALATSSATLEKTYREVYGVGLDLRAAIGETRLVISVNDDRPLRVHSGPPSDATEVVDKLPIGAVIFQAKKVDDRWWRGVIFREGEKTEVYFAGQYTKPLRDEMMEDSTAMAVGSQPMN